MIVLYPQKYSILRFVVTLQTVFTDCPHSRMVTAYVTGFFSVLTVHSTLIG